jgi:ATP-binding cassette subfamily F protein 3
MLTVSQLSKSFAGRALFDDVSLQVNRGDRIGLVGPNGAGKSTLFSLLLGNISPDKGTIAIDKNVTIGFLVQARAVSKSGAAVQRAQNLLADLRRRRDVVVVAPVSHHKHPCRVAGDETDPSAKSRCRAVL